MVVIDFRGDEELAYELLYSNSELNKDDNMSVNGINGGNLENSVFLNDKKVAVNTESAKAKAAVQVAEENKASLKSVHQPDALKKLESLAEAAKIAGSLMEQLSNNPEQAFLAQFNVNPYVAHNSEE